MLPLVLASLLALFPSSASPDLRFDAPAEWSAAPSSSSMRLAEWKFASQAEIVIFFFGAGQGGPVEANLERWYGQFEQPDGSATRERARVTQSTIGELKITRADVSGTFVAPIRPGAAERRNEPDYRMIAAVVEGPGGPWFIRFLGPRAEISKGEASFDTFLGTLRLE
jgi:hypothetical protein